MCLTAGRSFKQSLPMASRPSLSIQRTVWATINRPWTAYPTRPTAARCRFYSAPLFFIQKRQQHGLREFDIASRDASAAPGLFSYSPRALRQTCSNVPRNSLLNQICRRYSILSKPAVDKSLSPLRNPLHNRVAIRQFHLSTPLCYDRLQNLEDAANRDRDNANAQAVFLQV